MIRSCSICVRGGSKGVKNKNIRLINGMPLLHITLIQALKSGLFDEVVVSSDSEAILECASDFKEVHLVKRPDELATDQAAKLPAMQHCLLELEKKTGKTFETVIDLDATSPLRSIDDLKASVQLLESRPDAFNLITAAPARRSPYFNLVEKKSDGFVSLAKTSAIPLVRRQDAPECFDMNASIYIWKRENFFKAEKIISEKTILYTMPEERSIDIDSELDFKIVEMLLKERMNEFKR